MVHQNLLDEGKIEKLVGALQSREACPPELAATFRMEADYFEKNAARIVSLALFGAGQFKVFKSSGDVLKCWGTLETNAARLSGIQCALATR